MDIYGYRFGYLNSEKIASDRSYSDGRVGQDVAIRLSVDE